MHLQRQLAEHFQTQNIQIVTVDESTYVKGRGSLSILAKLLTEKRLLQSVQ